MQYFLPSFLQSQGLHWVTQSRPHLEYANLSHCVGSARNIASMGFLHDRLSNAQSKLQP